MSFGQISVPLLASVPSKIKIFAYCAILIFFFASTFKYSGVFADPVVFWQKALSSAPSYSAVYSNLGKVYLEREQNLDAAQTYLEKAYELNPNETNKNNLEKIDEIRKAGTIEEYVRLMNLKS
jgi:tetratricopeptide (TPR) repeat protein